MTRDVPGRDVPAYQRRGPRGGSGGGDGVVLFAPSCLLVFSCCWVVWFFAFFFFFIFCQRFALIFLCLGAIPGAVGCQACWRHIWPELFLSSRVKNGRISTQTASLVQLKPCARGPLQPPYRCMSLKALQTCATCRGNCGFMLSFATLLFPWV